MKAMHLVESPQGLTLQAADVPQPNPAAGEILIRVHAAGVTKTELNWYPSTHSKNGEPRHNAIPAHEFSGVVAALGEGVTSPAIGDEVYGMNDWFQEGAMAEYCVTVPSSISAKPASLTLEAAATVPIGALTAMQGLFDRAKLQPGERVLVHGGAGAVGIFVVQLAHLHGAHVIATASSSTMNFVKNLGADEVLDYRGTPFEQIVSNIDVVFDTVGGETGKRSRKILKPGGRMISIAAEGEVTTDPEVRSAYFIVEPNRAQLIEAARLFDSGKLKTFIDASVPLTDAAKAFVGQIQQRRGYGKTVVTIL
jgi:NADPH:quinone reductase-like Zn-dependent oxidoreductase